MKLKLTLYYSEVAEPKLWEIYLLQYANVIRKAEQILHSVATGSPPLQHLSK